MAKPLGLITTTFMVRPAHWRQFMAVAHARGTSAAGLLRQLMVKEIRQAAREARQDKAAEK